MSKTQDEFRHRLLLGPPLPPLSMPSQTTVKAGAVDAIAKLTTAHRTPFHP